MSDFKSKLPDLKELGSMTGKLFNDLKVSVTEIIDDYKKKRETVDQAESEVNAAPAAATSKAKVAPAKKTAAKKAATVQPTEKTEGDETKTD